MKISSIYKNKKRVFSLEVFPPKKNGSADSIYDTLAGLSGIKPDFISVTYGASGSTSKNTLGIVDYVQKKGVTALAHLTCVSSSREHVQKMVRIYKEKGIENILTLRGDIPRDGVLSQDYRHAVDLIHDVRELGDFCLGGACYPEGHVETPHKADDIRYLKEKVDAGLDFLTTQMFFDNNIFYNFLYRIRERGIYCPVIAGIMPITKARQLERSVAMSGTDVPQRFRAIVDRFGDDEAKMKQAGIIYATEQIVDLIANGIKHIHVYTMNNPEVAGGIMNNLSEILK